MLTAVIIIIFFSILIIVHELGHFLLSKKFGLFVEEFGLGLPPRAWGKKIGETIYSLNWLPFGGFVKIAGENREEEEEMSVKLPGEKIFYNLKIWKRSLILVGGVAMNFIFGWILISIVFWSGIPQEVFISAVQPNTPAANAGIQINDRITGFDNLNDFIGYVNQNKGKQITLKLERSGQEVDINIVPRANPPQGEGALGVGLIEAGQAKQGFFKGIWEALKLSAQIFATIFVGIFTLIKSAILGQGSLAAVTGPVGIVKITAQTSHLGFLYLLQLMALISINLGAINIFPFPALDGGRLLFLLIEKIKGSPLPRRFEGYANAVGMGLLLLLMVIITIKDIGRFL